MALVRALCGSSRTIKVCPLQFTLKNKLFRNEIACTRYPTQHTVPIAVSLMAAKPFSVSPQLAAAAGHDHSKMWAIEKVVAASMYGIIPACFLVQSPALEYVLNIILVMHNHWGWEAAAIDYVRPIIFGPLVPKVALGLVYLLSVLNLCGLFYFTYSDVGIIQAIKMIWKL